MKNGKLTFIIVGVAVVASAVFVIWKKIERNALILANPPIEKPLILEGGADSVTEEQQQKIDEFKRKILTRASLKVPLTAEERINFEILLIKGNNSSVEGQVFADQSLLKFTEEELQSISDAVKYR